jgi:hypothetical protein
VTLIGSSLSLIKNSNEFLTCRAKEPQTALHLPLSFPSSLVTHHCLRHCHSRNHQSPQQAELGPPPNPGYHHQLPTINPPRVRLSRRFQVSFASANTEFAKSKPLRTVPGVVGLCYVPEIKFLLLASFDLIDCLSFSPLGVAVFPSPQIIPLYF